MIALVVLAILLQIDVSDIILNVSIVIFAILAQFNLIKIDRLHIFGATGMIFALKLILPLFKGLPALVSVLFKLAGNIIFLLIAIIFIMCSGIGIQLAILFYIGFIIVIIGIVLHIISNLFNIFNFFFGIFENIKSILIGIVTVVSNFLKSLSVHSLEALILLSPLLYSSAICLCVLSAMSNEDNKLLDNLINWAVLIVFILGINFSVYNLNLNVGLLIGFANLICGRRQRW